MKSFLRTLIVSMIIVGISGGLVWGFLAGRKEKAAETEHEAPAQGASRVTTENGETQLVLDARAQKANGIVTAVLVQSRQRIVAQANAVVLQLQPLLDLKTSFNSAQMDIAKTHATAQASRAEYERLRQLNQNGKNASDKAVEAAHATAESDGAATRSAEQTVAILRDSAKLHWGTVVAGWLEQGSPQLDALLAQHEFLLQVTSPSMTSAAAPQQSLVRYPDSTFGTAHLISILPQLDPRLQAPSFLYLISAHAGIVPGINLPASLPSGPARNGVVVPNDAVVWWQGQAWCYVEESPGKFERRAVPTSNPIADGWFVSENLDSRTEGLDPKTLVVTQGAQMLLSAEFRSQGETDTDTDED